MLSSNTSAANGGANYIEDVFSTWLYTGNGSTQTITNGIDLAGKGGLVWQKNRGSAIKHWLYDSAQSGALVTNATDAAYTANDDVDFTSTGFITKYLSGNVNLNGANYVSWTFRKQEKFFDVVTYTGNDVAGRTVAHNLGSEPAVIIVKSTSAAGDWAVYHRSLGATKYILLNGTAAAVTDSSHWQNTTPTSTEFTLGGAGRVNYGGRSYVAYLFAHNAGGFGLTGTDNVISCGSFTGAASGTQTITLGYEPQLVFIKRTDAAQNWYVQDNMRGFLASTNSASLSPNLSTAESATTGYSLAPNANGFSYLTDSASATYIYIAIRRGPMKVPESGTSVFSPNIGATDTTPVTTGFPVDLLMDHSRGFSGLNTAVLDRLRGTFGSISSSNGNESDYGTPSRFQSNTSVLPDLFGNDFVSYSFRRAPGFFDEVCYTGTSAVRTVAHNLGVAPELMIVKSRTDATYNWSVYSSGIDPSQYLILNATNISVTNNIFWNSTPPTASVFTVGTAAAVNRSGYEHVAYLFATCPGVSKVGSFTGTGATQVINCGFTGGARFVLIKSTSATGNWYVWDSARGIVAGNDPYLLLNSNNAEVTNTDWVDTAATGFELSNAGGNLANSSGVSYIFLAIA